MDNPLVKGIVIGLAVVGGIALLGALAMLIGCGVMGWRWHDGRDDGRYDDSMKGICHA